MKLSKVLPMIIFIVGLLVYSSSFIFLNEKILLSFLGFLLFIEAILLIIFPKLDKNLADISFGLIFAGNGVLMLQGWIPELRWYITVYLAIFSYYLYRLITLKKS